MALLLGQLAFSANAQDIMETVTGPEPVNDPTPIAELEMQETLPEVRFVTIGASVALGGSFYRTDATSDGAAFCGKAGINFDIPIGQVFSIQPELMFATRGGGFDLAGSTYTDHLFYMDLPINLKFSKRMSLGSLHGRGFFSVAPVISMGLYGKGEKEFGNSTTEYHPMQNDADKELADALYKNFEFSTSLRIGYDLDNGLSFAIGYQLGLTDIVSSDMEKNVETYYKDKFYGTSLPKLHNNSLFLQVGYNW